MMYQKKTFTVPAAPKPKQIHCCEKCVYGRGQHSTHCTKFPERDTRGLLHEETL